MDAQRALGTTLCIESTSTITVARLSSIGGLELSADTIDVTTLDSDGGYREFIAGFKDAGEVSLEGFFVPEIGKGQKELYNLFENGDEENFSINFPNGAKWEFKGVVVGFSTSADLEDPLAFSSSIKVSGKPTLTEGAATANTSLAALIIGTKGLNPAFNRNVISYNTLTDNTEDIITAIPVKTGAAVEIKVDGTLATNGEEYTWGANGLKIVTVKVTDSGSSTTYTVNVTKTS